jgi:hypothetical protein
MQAQKGLFFVMRTRECGFCFASPWRARQSHADGLGFHFMTLAKGDGEITPQRA